MTYSIIQVVTNNYDKIYDCLDTTASHRFLFTDIKQPVKNWEQTIIPASTNHPWDDIFWYRWHPFNVADTDYVIWIDGSIKVTGNLVGYIAAMEKNGYNFATLRHPSRNTIWDEYVEWIRIRNYPKLKAFCWMAVMEKSGWKPTNEGLYQVNVCIFKNTPIIREFGEKMWQMLHLFDADHAERLDQTIATYLLKHKYADSIKVLPLTDAIYHTSKYLKWHGEHPAY